MRRIIIICIAFTVVAIISECSLQAMTIGESITAVADRLHNEQIKDGIFEGCWRNEYDMTGSITAGLVKAYDIVCRSDYLSAAELGGYSIVLLSGGDFYGDEVYALENLDRNKTDPNYNYWHQSVANFYDNVKFIAGGTELYIQNNFQLMDASLAVFYLANHVLSAYYIDTADKQIWRQKLIEYLSYVDDSCFYPVMALGAATWALAQTGPLDGTVIHSSSGHGAPYWNKVKLSELPGLLISHQVNDDKPGAGGFYWQFTHTENSPNGYTEDAVFATLGLAAAYNSNPDSKIYTAIKSARAALLNGISSEGKVWERLSQEGALYYVYAGEMLQVISELVVLGDIDLNGIINLDDFNILYENWGFSDCNQKCWCNGSDLNRDGTVDYQDLEIFIDAWVEQVNQ